MALAGLKAVSKSQLKAVKMHPRLISANGQEIMASIPASLKKELLIVISILF
jgi:hypothetical protein